MVARISSLIDFLKFLSWLASLLINSYRPTYEPAGRFSPIWTVEGGPHYTHQAPSHTGVPSLRSYLVSC